MHHLGHGYKHFLNACSAINTTFVRWSFKEFCWNSTERIRSSKYTKVISLYLSGGQSVHPCWWLICSSLWLVCILHSRCIIVFEITLTIFFLVQAPTDKILCKFLYRSAHSDFLFNAPTTEILWHGWYNNTLTDHICEPGPQNQS